MTEQRKSRKAALAGQLKGKGKPIPSARQRAQEGLMGSMDNLNALIAGKSAEKTEDDSAVQASAPQADTGSETTSKPHSNDVVDADSKANKLQDDVAHSVAKTTTAPSGTVEASPEQEAPIEASTPTKEAPKVEPAAPKVEPAAPKVEPAAPKVEQDTSTGATDVAPAATESVAADAAASLKSGVSTIEAEPVEPFMYAKDVDEIHNQLSKGMRYLEVNTKDVRSSKDNHRKFGLSFSRYLELVPPLPENWEQLTGADYVEQVWSSIILDLSDSGELDDAQARKMKESLTGIYDLGYSIETQYAIHPPLGYVVYDDETGKPDYVELVSGEKRLRSHYMFGRKRFDMHFTKNSTSARPSPQDVFQRKVLRLAENTKSTKPDDSEILAGISDLHEAHKQIEGEAAVARLSAAELVRRYISALPTTDANLAEMKESMKEPPRHLQRWVSAACHSQSAALRRIIRESQCGIARLDPVRTQAERRAKELDIELSPELVYAIAIMSDRFTFSIDKVPEVLREKTDELLVTLKKADESDDVENSELIDQLEEGRSSKASKRAARKARESTAALRAFGVTAPKGNNGAAARESAFTQLLVATVMLKGGLSQEDAERFRLLNSLKGEASQDDKLTEYRLLMVEGHKALEEYRQRLAGSSHEINRLIDSLEGADDPLALIKKLQPSNDHIGGLKR